MFILLIGESIINKKNCSHKKFGLHLNYLYSRYTFFGYYIRIIHIFIFLYIQGKTFKTKLISLLFTNC